MPSRIFAHAIPRSPRMRPPLPTPPAALRHRSSTTRLYSSNRIPGGSPTRPSRAYRYARNISIITVLGVAGWQADTRLNSAALTRSARTLWAGFTCTVDYKWNFNPQNSEQIGALHERVSQRLHSVIVTNQGLYIKLGQALGLQAALLPKPYRIAFANIFDAAPTVPHEEIVNVFKEDLGKAPEELFESFEPKAIGSASIAQVHKAVIRRHAVDHAGQPTGQSWLEEVAVKVQKPAIRKQIEWDLWSYRFLSVQAERIFQMPMAFIADYVSQQMKLETDFNHESQNAQKCAAHLANTPELIDRVYVPKVYPEVAGTGRVMVMEYVKGCQVTDVEKIKAMGFKPQEIMDTVIELMSAMTFQWGFVHCDPHSANMLVRPDPKDPKKPQVVVLDHGLYQELTPKFKKEYATLWRSLFAADIGTVGSIAKEWGINLDINLFSSAIVLQPFQVAKSSEQDLIQRQAPKPKTDYEAQVELKERIRNMLENEKLIPRELIFIGRSQRIVQSLNQLMGSPSQRLKITARWARRGWLDQLTPEERSLRSRGLRAWLEDRSQQLVFRLGLVAMDLTFRASQIKHWWHRNAENGKKGFEDDLMHKFSGIAESYGIALDDDAFAA